MLPIDIIIKIFSYLPSILEGGKRDPWFLQLRLLRKKIAAAFRPNRLFLTNENLFNDMSHIKTLEWCTNISDYNDVKKIINNSNITKLITDRYEYNFINFPNIKSLNCKLTLNVLANERYSNLSYYKGPYNVNLKNFIKLEKICLITVSNYMVFGDNIKKITIECDCDDKKINVSFSKIEKLVIKKFGKISKLKLPSTLKILKISGRVMNNNMIVISDCYNRRSVEFKLIMF